MPIPDIRLNNVKISDVVIPDVPKWMSSDPPVALPSDSPSSYDGDRNSHCQYSWMCSGTQRQ